MSPAQKKVTAYLFSAVFHRYGSAPQGHPGAVKSDETLLRFRRIYYHFTACVTAQEWL